MLMLDYNAICLFSARQSLSVTQVLKNAKLSNLVLVKIKKGSPVQTRTVGKLAKALGVDVSDIVVKIQDMREMNKEFKSLPFKTRLKKIRENIGLTQTELANRMGVLPSAISRYETSDTTPIQRSIDKLGSGLGVPPDVLTNDTIAINAGYLSESDLEVKAPFELLRNHGYSVIENQNGRVTIQRDSLSVTMESNLLQKRVSTSWRIAQIQAAEYANYLFDKSLKNLTLKDGD